MNIQPILKQLREAEKIATKDWNHTNAGASIYDKTNLVCENMSESEDDEVSNNNNFELIVLMRNNLIPLLDRIEELEDEVKLWKDRAYEAGYCHPL